MALLSDAVLYMLLITTRTLHYTVFVRFVRVHCFSLLVRGPLVSFVIVIPSR